MNRPRRTNTNDDVAKDLIGLYIRDIRNIPLLTAEEERDLAYRVREGDKDAKKKLTESNLRLVIRIARNYTCRGLELIDLIQAGNLGLMHGIDKYDPTLGYRLSTYVTFWIRQSISRAITDSGRTIRIPAHIAEDVNKLKSAVKLLTAENCGDPTIEELSEATGFDMAKVRDLLSYASDLLSLDKVIGDDGFTLMDKVANEESEIYDVLDYDARRDAIEKVLLTLTERESQVIRMRFGLDGNLPMTLEQIGGKFGITRERVRQIEAKALRKLRSHGRAEMLIQYA